MNDESLCCCEYINDEGERSHLAATLCNCEAIDEAFERLITRQKLNPELIKKIWDTLDDRFRIPCPKGARKVHTYFLPFIFNFILIMLGSVSHYFTIVTYLIILPLVLFICHRLLKSKRRIYYTHSKSISRLKLRNNLLFYKIWAFSTTFYLIFVYYAYVIPKMKISSLENMLFVFLFLSMCTSLYIVMRKGQLVIESKSETTEDSSQCQSCLQCAVEPYKPSSHCNICGACFTMRDHHCLWLNTCIGRENDRWFLVGLIFSLACLLYGAQLTFTTICHPKIYNIGPFEILYPYQCPNAYFNFSSSVMYSAGCYSLLVIVCVTVLLIQQICSVSRRTNKHIKSCNLFYKIVSNWYWFWNG